MSNVYIVSTCSLNLMMGGPVSTCLRQPLRTGFGFSASARNVEPPTLMTSDLRRLSPQTKNQEPFLGIFFKIISEGREGHKQE